MKKILLAFITLSFAACRDDYWTVQRSESFVSEKKQAEKIICIRPQITFQSSEKNLDVDAMKKLTKQFKKYILNYAKKNHVPIEIKLLDENANADYYNSLMTLKQNAMNINFGDYKQNTTSVRPERKTLMKGVFIYPPKISYEFNSLSKTFGTNYFSFIKVVIFDGEFVLDHVVIDTDLSETVYSEHKVMEHKFKEALFKQIVYDSFSLLHNELKAKPAK